MTASKAPAALDEVQVAEAEGDIDFSALYKPVPYAGAEPPVRPEIMEWVEDSYKFWLDNQDSWRTVTLSSEQAVKVAVSEARRYCTRIRLEPLTFQVKSAGTSGEKLTYRVRETIRRGYQV